MEYITLSILFILATVYLARYVYKLISLSQNQSCNKCTIGKK